MIGETVNVLLVEDDEIDAMVVRRAFKKHNIANPLHEARSGLEALDALRGNGQAPLAKPYIVLLDLNMPGMDGFEFLEEIRKDEDLRDSIVFVLTTSEAEEDRVRAYALNVAGYMVKSDLGPSFAKAVALLDDYLKAVVLP